VDNLVSAMWSAATAPEATNQNFIVSDRERLTWRDLYFSVADGVGMPAASIDDVPAEVALGMLNNRSALTRLESAFKTKPAARIRAAMPERTAAKLKAAARAFVSAPAPDHEPAQGPRVDAETVKLQLCRTQLPIAKAERLLGYDPLPAEEGFRRTNAWLRSTGFCQG
jgi:hypothetical protein